MTEKEDHLEVIYLRYRAPDSPSGYGLFSNPEEHKRLKRRREGATGSTSTRFVTRINFANLHPAGREKNPLRGISIYRRSEARESKRIIPRTSFRVSIERGTSVKSRDHGDGPR